ncbi:MAG: DUF1003 domain-containing protein [Verrucomicrobiaceae bacterium]|nr:MAG: DUF1003 domain-containing protein [Verrucomicrobiaceae bacterium]
MSHQPTSRPVQNGMAQVVERNIHALLERRQKEEQKQTRQEWIAGIIARFTGSMTFVYIHGLIYGSWILINSGVVTWVPKFDPSFVILAMVASVEAIFLSTFILITQNRMNVLADRRADLNLQISLLAEHEVTQLVELVSAMAKQMNIQQAANPQLDELKQDVHPETVLDTIEAINTAKKGEDAGA